ncbi:MAG: hypothetical protein LBT66_04355 [Methanobrevibacter sp.]|jgi:hypothetical protein|nr:hypothetical protein [Candidatus Methanovirga meridionalis]
MSQEKLPNELNDKEITKIIGVKETSIHKNVKKDSKYNKLFEKEKKEQQMLVNRSGIF